MEQEVNLKMVCIAKQSYDAASKVFVDAIRGYLSDHRGYDFEKKRYKDNAQNTKGKMVKAKELRKDGANIEFVDIEGKDLKEFRRYAKKYGVTYSMEKDNSTVEPTYRIFFQAKDSKLIDGALISFLDYKASAKEKGKENSIEALMNEAMDKVAGQVKKVKNKEQIR